MADSTTEIDLDSVIDRLLEGELSPAPRDAFRLLTLSTCFSSPRQSSWQARSAPGVRDKVFVHKGEGNFHQPAHLA